MTQTLSLRTNGVANRRTHTLSENIAKLLRSTERLSNGLRINGSKDDTSGLAIREEMRADIAATHQGIRNCMNAISLIQSTDGALGIIDEKLICMRELAEQVASGTYNEVQRQMINQEFLMMGSEISRIANANTWNEIHIINTNSVSESSDSEYLFDANYVRLHATTALKTS